MCISGLILGPDVPISAVFSSLLMRNTGHPMTAPPIMQMRKAWVPTLRSEMNPNAAGNLVIFIFCRCALTHFDREHNTPIGIAAAVAFEKGKEVRHTESPHGLMVAALDTDLAALDTGISLTQTMLISLPTSSSQTPNPTAEPDNLDILCPQDFSLVDFARANTSQTRSLRAATRPTIESPTPSTTNGKQQTPPPPTWGAHAKCSISVLQTPDRCPNLAPVASTTTSVPRA
ncbi:hypothetical protein BGW80DRAFT_1254589 [Lactifluus volemus]|nr:hypothetical protein BGW80DRAFT_1254589 [Lactifluus volemus]